MISKTTLLKSSMPVVLCSLLLMGCGGNGDEQDDTVQQDTVQQAIDPNKANIVNVSGKLFSIPSPVQTSLLIRKLGLGVTPGITNPVDKADQYTAKAVKALNMGIYGADLGYMTVFNNSQGALDYLKVIQGLAEDLDVSNAFNAELIKRFNNGVGNEDSLLVIAADAFRAADAYLKNNERNEVAAMILAGGWVESLHFSITSAGDNPDAAVMQRIAEQRTSLNNLITLLKEVDQEGECRVMIAQLEELSGVFDQVNISYQFEHPTAVVEEKTTYINSSTNVEISPEQIKEMAAKLARIRNSITG